jgi:hypothetical protein
MADRSSPLGFDLAIGPTPPGVDMSPTGRNASDAELVRNGMIARSMADTIPMIGAPGGVRAFGRNVRNWVGAAWRDGDEETRAQELAIVYARDPRVDGGSIRVVLTRQKAGAFYSFTIAVNAFTTTAQPIAMVLGVTAISVDILAQQTATA